MSPGRARSKFSGLSCSSSRARRSRMSPSVLSEVSGNLRDLPRIDAEAARAPSPRYLYDAFEKRCPHVELDLLRDPKAVIQELGEAIAAPRPRLDAKLEQLAVRRPKLDLTGLQMAGERDEPKRSR